MSLFPVTVTVTSVMRQSGQDSSRDFNNIVPKHKIVDLFNLKFVDLK